MGYDSSWGGLFWGLLVLVIVSTASFVPAIIMLVMLPATYFQDSHRPALSLLEYHPILRWLIWMAKNIAGLLLIAVGVFLALPGIPGQGLLTILIGVLILDLPGKRRLERWLIGRPTILRSVNRLRIRFGKPPLILDQVNPRI